MPTARWRGRIAEPPPVRSGGSVGARSPVAAAAGDRTRGLRTAGKRRRASRTPELISAERLAVELADAPGERLHELVADRRDLVEDPRELTRAEHEHGERGTGGDG